MASPQSSSPSSCNPSTDLDFFSYWENFGFFENLQSFLPAKFLIIFEIARTLFNEQSSSEAWQALEDLSAQDEIPEIDRSENIMVNRVDKSSPLSDQMELGNFKNINELKKALPRELALDQDVFDVKLFTKTLLVQNFYELDSDSFKSISSLKDEQGNRVNKFEQKVYLLLDCSRSMELKWRSFYSKCLVSEFLRRKFESKAKIYFRSFDSKAKELFKLVKKEDFSYLIEQVLLTSTGGSSTNLQQAIFQAINDLEYEKEMLDAEILVVTDGVSKIDKEKLRKRLGKIKLNILKIGDELPSLDFYSLKSVLEEEGVDFDFSSVGIKEVKEQVKKLKEDQGSNSSQKRAFQIISDYSDQMFKDLKEVANKYIEIGDLEVKNLDQIDEAKISYFNEIIVQFEEMVFASLNIDQKKKVYKQISFFKQYLEMFLSSNKLYRQELNSFLNRINLLKEKMFKDSEFLLTILQVENFSEDKKNLKIAKKELKKLISEMQIKNKNFDLDSLAKAKLLFTFKMGEGGGLGKLLVILFKKIFLFFVKFFKRG